MPWESFFEKIGRFTRIVNIDNIGVKGIEGSTDPSRTLNSTCTATTFVFGDEAGSDPDENMAPAGGKAARQGQDSRQRNRSPQGYCSRQLG